jgi:HTH-type transcriptional regulator, sugar sensing transcriptional regulator
LLYFLDNMDNEALINLGLSDEESQIYLSLLSKGQQSASDLAKSTKVKRTYIYSVSASLIKKGLVSQVKKGKAKVFNPLSPDKLLTLAQEKKQKAQQAEQTLEAILPNLKTKFEVVDAKPVVTYYEGIEGIKKVYMDTINERETIYSFMQNADIDPQLREWLKEIYVKERVKYAVPAKVILASGDFANEYVKRSKDLVREVKVVQSNKYPFQVEVNIYGDKIAFMNFKSKADPLGVIIENKDLAQTMLTFFNLTWNELPKS